MPILGRLPGETILLPTEHVAIRDVGINGNPVRLGIAAARLRQHSAKWQCKCDTNWNGTMKLHHTVARILVATPDRHLLNEYCAALCKDGAEASAASNGVQCLELLRCMTPDLVVLDTDLLWGGADGVLAVLADDPAYATVPAMVLSSRHSRSAIYQVAMFIVADYQLKPMAGQHLIRRIHFLFESMAISEFKSPQTFPFVRSAEHLPAS